MVLVSHHALKDLSNMLTSCRPTSNVNIFNDVPVIDFRSPNAKTLIVKACKEYGFFKLTNHGVSMELLVRLEEESLKFFKMSQTEKDMLGPPNPFGYGSKNIGRKGDVGWVEYLLICADAERISRNPHDIIPGLSDTLWELVEEYVVTVKNMACEVVEMIAEGMGLESDTLSRMMRDENSDSCLRLNHYPTCPELEALELVGFGEHTDPQIISVLRSNNAAGLQICLKDSTWVAVPPDHSTFFFNVGDSLQVMTNGRFQSVKHRVMADSYNERMSMIYFGGPPLCQKIAPLSRVMEPGEETLYKEFTWLEYKQSAYTTKLGDDRLRLFEKPPADAASSSSSSSLAD